MAFGFQRRSLPGLNLHVLPTGRFKRVTAVLVWQEGLSEETASSFALLPRLLRRGSRPHPTLPELERALAGLYGATLSAGVEKIGDRHVGTLTMTWPAARYVPGQPPAADLPARALELLFEVLADPLLEGDAFPEERVAEERRAQIERIRALINDKAAYAVRRCVAAMCAGEPYGVSELGEPARLESLDGRALAAFHRRVLERSPLDLFVLGEVDPDELAAAVERALDLLPGDRRPGQLPPPVLRAAREQPRRVEETQPMEQGWLILGLRAEIGFDHPLWPALEMYNGVLGGFVHSKLFLHVRERASLAYAAFSRLVRGKGLLLAMAGIDPAKRQEAEEIMLRQIEDARAGRITDEELEATRRSLIDRIRSDMDRPGAVIRAALEREIFGRDEDAEEEIRALSAVSKDDVREVARRVQLDTVYFLHGPRGE
ncbi:MAG TPA: pitrilysin family protein [Thermaerobacter sp.]